MEDSYVKAFFENQERLFDFPVADNYEEARDFLEDCTTEIFDDFDDLIDFLSDNMDVSEITKDNLLDEVLEVFVMPDGKYLYVEA